MSLQLTVFFWGLFFFSIAIALSYLYWVLTGNDGYVRLSLRTVHVVFTVFSVGMVVLIALTFFSGRRF